MPGFGWVPAAALYAATLGGAALTEAVPSTARRTTAVTVTVVGSALALTAAPAPDPVAWLAPLLLIKPVLGHAVDQEVHR